MSGTILAVLAVLSLLGILSPSFSASTPTRMHAVSLSPLSLSLIDKQKKNCKGKEKHGVDKTNPMVCFQADSYSEDLGLDTVGNLCKYT